MNGFKSRNIFLQAELYLGLAQWNVTWDTNLILKYELQLTYVYVNRILSNKFIIQNTEN